MGTPRIWQTWAAITATAAFAVAVIWLLASIRSELRQANDNLWRVASRVSAVEEQEKWTTRAVESLIRDLSRR